MSFALCENTGFFLRLGLIGPSGSGKTYSALSIATALGYEKIGIIDTENRSARRYATTFGKRFHTLELENFSPKDYVEAIRKAEAAGIEVLIIDSLSHAWMGKGGVLEMVDLSAKRQARGGTGSSFNGWREVTPEHNRLVDALVHAKLHLIVTMRVKTEYVVEQDNRGKSVPRKVGLAPVQRDGLEYEFDIIADMSPDHDFCVTKSRCPALADAVVRNPGSDVAQMLREWLNGATTVIHVKSLSIQQVRVDPVVDARQRISHCKDIKALDYLIKRIADSDVFDDATTKELTAFASARRLERCQWLVKESVRDGEPSDGGDVDQCEGLLPCNSHPPGPPCVS